MRKQFILPGDFLRQAAPGPIPDIKTYVHKRIQIALGLGRTPWAIPVAYDPNCGLPHNVRTGGRYRGINTILLCDAYHTHDYRSKWWGTADDWKAVRATVRLDEVPTIIVHYIGDVMRSLEERRVFNAHQVRGADHLLPAISQVVLHEDADFGLMGMFMEHHHPEIRYDVGDHEVGPDYIGYRPPYPWSRFPNHDLGDYILMQSIGKCANKATHFSILLHEFIHWTEPRTGWMHCLPVREFVAEMGMHVLGLELGVPHALDDHNRFLWQRHWNAIANRDNEFFVWAAAQVDRACDFLLGPILHRQQEFFHDPWCVTPRLNVWPGEDGMRFGSGAS